MADPKLPNIPSVPGAVPTALRQLLVNMRTVLVETNFGTDRVLRQSELEAIGIIKRGPGNTLTPGTGTGDLSTPPAPTGLRAGGALASIILSWDAPRNADNLAGTEIWRSDTDDLSKAVLIGQAPGQVYVDNVGGGATKYYFIRYVSLANITGPFNAQTGVKGMTGTDPGYLLDVLSANPPPGSPYANNVLYVQAEDMTINGVLVPKGVYFNNGYVRNLSITNAMMGIASIDTLNVKIGAIKEAQIDELAVTNGKIGGFIQSNNYVAGTQGAGWKIDKNGNAEFNTGTFRGNLAAAGGTFSGALSAASGTFVGNLVAAGGTFRGNLVAAGGSFSGTLSAAIGSFSGTITASDIVTGQIRNSDNSTYINLNTVYGSGVPAIRAGNYLYRNQLGRAEYDLALYSNGSGFIARALVQGEAQLVATGSIVNNGGIFGSGSDPNGYNSTGNSYAYGPIYLDTGVNDVNASRGTDAVQYVLKAWARSSVSTISSSIPNGTLVERWQIFAKVGVSRDMFRGSGVGVSSTSLDQRIYMELTGVYQSLAGATTWALTQIDWALYRV